MDFDPKLMATIGTSFITSLAANGITGPAETINDLWKASFGYPIHYFSEKRRIKYEINLKKFEKELTEKILEIPKENIQEPKESIIGPALEASKYYFDEKEIRDMFANLIASSMDSAYNGLSQHSFVEIIKQLSPYDAVLFNALKDITPLEILKNDFSFSSPDFPDYELNTISLNNLKRLGLVDILYDYTTYDSRSTNTWEGLMTPPGKELDKSVNASYHITAFGKAFKMICIKDSL